MTNITELAQLRDRTVDYPYYLVECDCGKIYPSSELSGGEPMGDSGDYSDCYCPHCGEGEEHFAECADPETAWKAQQDKIDALVEALEKAQETIAFQQGEIKALLSSLESSTVELPDELSGEILLDNASRSDLVYCDDTGVLEYTNINGCFVKVTAPPDKVIRFRYSNKCIYIRLVDRVKTHENAGIIIDFPKNNKDFIQ